MSNKLDLTNFSFVKLGSYAGFSIALGGLFYISVLSHFNFSHYHKLISSAFFSIGLILVIFMKSQLFTGNVLMVLLFRYENIKKRDVLRNWVFVYFGNFLGSIFLSLLIYNFISTEVSEKLILVAQSKVNLSFTDAMVKAIFCNMLVCLSVGLAIQLKQLYLKLIGIIVPITLFVLLGYEHSVANMFFIPLGLALKLGPDPKIISLLLENLVPVTIGNIIGGAFLAVSWKFLLGAYRSSKGSKMH